MTDEEVFRYVEREVIRIAGRAAFCTDPRCPYCRFLRGLGGEVAASLAARMPEEQRDAAALKWRTDAVGNLTRYALARLPQPGSRTLVAIADVLELPR